LNLAPSREPCQPWGCVYLAEGRQADVEVAYGTLGQHPVIPGLLHEGESTTWLLSAVADLKTFRDSTSLDMIWDWD